MRLALDRPPDRSRRHAQRRPNRRSISALLSLSTVGRPWLQVAARGVASICRSSASISAPLQPPPGADAAVAGQPGQHGVQPLVERGGLAVSASSSARSCSSGAGSGAPSTAGSARTSTGAGAEPLHLQPEPRQRAAAAEQQRASRRRQVDHGRQQQRLRPHPARRVLRRAAPRASAARAPRAGPPAPGCHRSPPPARRCRRSARAAPPADAPAHPPEPAARAPPDRPVNGRLASAKPGLARRRPARHQPQRRPPRPPARRSPTPAAARAPPASARRSAPITQPAHRVRIAEPQLGLGRVHVDVDLLRRHGQDTAPPPDAAPARSRRGTRPAAPWSAPGRSPACR